MKNYFAFCAYLEGENVIFATFSFDDKFEKLKDAYDHILGLLEDGRLYYEFIFNDQEISYDYVGI